MGDWTVGRQGLFPTPACISSPSRTSLRASTNLDVSPIDILLDWVSGQTLPQLADAHLTAVPDPAYRIEQMVGAASEHFEHYLAWTVGAVVELVNTRLLDADIEVRLCPDLAGYIRYGVDSTTFMRACKTDDGQVLDLNQL